MYRELSAAVEETAQLRALIEADVERQSLCSLMHGASATDEFYLGTRQSDRIAGTTSPLYAHQKYGVRWLLALHNLGLRGGILADEMGLGKTIQTIGFFTALAKQGALGTYLVVAPLSTLENWRREWQHWAPWMHVEVFRGNHAERTKVRRRIRTRHRRAFQKKDVLRQSWLQGTPPSVLAKDLGGVVLASYEMVLADNGALARLLHWDVTIVDEAQRLKKFDCRLLRMLNKATCGLRLILTGTPVQNTAKELWTLLSYIAPDHFGQAQLSPSALTDSADVEVQSALTAALQQALHAFMLRRTKQCVGIALPPKLDLILSAPLTPRQHSFYTRVQQEGKYSSGRLVHLRKCCIHPFLFPEFEAEAGACRTEERQTRESTSVSPDGEPTPEACDLQTFLAYSGKMRLLDRLLSGLRLPPEESQRSRPSGHRVLLFSQMTKALDVVEHYLHLKEAAIRAAQPRRSSPTRAEKGAPFFPYVRLDGASSAEARLASIAAFQPKQSSISQVEDNVVSSEEEKGAPGYSQEMGVRCTGHGNERSGMKHRGLVRGQYVEEGVADDDCIFDAASPSSAFTPLHRPTQRAPLTERSANQLPSASQKKAYTVFGCQGSLPRHGAAAQPPERQPTRFTTPDPALHAFVADEVESPFLFLISTKTGGAGLNLTAADTVIMLDGDYNPQNDQQAVDRCHRIGQTWPVIVYRLVTPESVEEQQLAVVTSKLVLESQLLVEAAVEARPGHKRLRSGEKPALPATDHSCGVSKPLFVCFQAQKNTAAPRTKPHPTSAQMTETMTFVPLVRAYTGEKTPGLTMDTEPLPDVLLSRVLNRDAMLHDVRAAL